MGVAWPANRKDQRIPTFMRAYDLAKQLLNGPDSVVVMMGIGSDEGIGPFEVTQINYQDDELFISQASQPDGIDPDVHTATVSLNYD